MSRILAISSQTIFGPVGNSVAVPALQSLGHQVLALPTILLSHHPGHGVPVVQRTEDVEGHLERLDALGQLSACDGVLTGYFASHEQVVISAQTIARMRASRPDLLVLVDPVMGDHGKLYVKQDIAEAIRDLLLPLANIVTPNVFELSWLVGTQLSTNEEIFNAAQETMVPEAVVTSVPKGADLLSTLGLTRDVTMAHHMKREEHVPHGTGDLLSALYLGHRLKTPMQLAFTSTMKSLERCIAFSTGAAELDLTRTLFGR
jgi:pyridoxine kinase